MLPWLFAVLLALNLALFWWGRQHEVPIEPQLPPLPEAPHQIELLGMPGAVSASLPTPTSRDASPSPETNVPGIASVLAGKGPGPDRAPPAAADNAEPPAPAAAPVAPAGVAVPEPLAQDQQGQAAPPGEDAVSAPDEGAPPHPPPVVEQPGPPAPDEWVAAPPRVYVPDPGPSEKAEPGPAASDGAGPNPDLALPAAPAAPATTAAVAPKAAKPRKAKKPTRKPLSVEPPVEFQ